MEPKYNFTYKWTQPYTGYSAIGLRELAALQDLVVEQMLEENDFKEANELIAKIKAL